MVLDEIAGTIRCSIATAASFSPLHRRQTFLYSVGLVHANATTGVRTRAGSSHGAPRRGRLATIPPLRLPLPPDLHRCPQQPRVWATRWFCHSGGWWASSRMRALYLHKGSGRAATELAHVGGLGLVQGDCILRPRSWHGDIPSDGEESLLVWKVPSMPGPLALVTRLWPFEIEALLDQAKMGRCCTEIR
jgi:hypothetical protein